MSLWGRYRYLEYFGLNGKEQESRNLANSKIVPGMKIEITADLVIIVYPEPNTVARAQ